MKHLRSDVFRSTERGDRNSNLMLPGKNVMDSAIACLENALPDHILSDRNLDLQLAVADYDFACRRQMHSQRIVGENTNHIVVLG
jgi:hypothetical protein